MAVTRFYAPKFLRRIYAVLGRRQQAVVSGRAAVRIARSDKGLHAKLYATPEFITLGSSNFTHNGLRRQSEANVRFERKDARYAEARRLADGFWEQGEDYSRDFLSLLDDLLRSVTWQEALARGCAEVLEGHWARKYIPPEELASLVPPMWPHQLQGLSQAIWTLYNYGSVLVADATGSGKTRLGAWLLRAAHDRLLRFGASRRLQPVMIAPPAVIEAWKEQLTKAGLGLRVESHGLLSHTKSYGHDVLAEAIQGTELLAIDEAHNFINPSGRTRRMGAHYADNVVLFTATPINRGPGDLLGIVELLGADNFSNETLGVLKGLLRLKRIGAQGSTEHDREAIRQEISKFLVRRTRHDLNTIATSHPEAYRLPSGRCARYPRHLAYYYELEQTESDRLIAQRIVDLTDQLVGVGRLGEKLERPAILAIEGMSEEAVLARLLASTAALAKYTVLKCLRSSRAALYEHIWGTEAAIQAFLPGMKPGGKSDTGDTVGRLRSLAGHPPQWNFERLTPDQAPLWLTNSEAHAEICLQEIARYGEIARLTCELSEDRERRKVEVLSRLAQDKALVLAFDSHLLSLSVFKRGLDQMGTPTSVFVGADGVAGKRKAMARLGQGASQEPFVALCSDVLSEGMNLQGASVVVHLDTPTVIRTAEQRAGRVDRMNSEHDTVEIWWPREPAPFAVRNPLWERHETVSDLIGANLQLPEVDLNSEQVIRKIAHEANIDRQESDPQDFFDAFRPVRSLVEGAQALVPPRVYDEMRDSQANVIACVAAVKSDAAWAFFAVGGAGRVAPRWVFVDQGSAFIADLAGVSAALRHRLTPVTATLPTDDHAISVLEPFVAELERSEIRLLPVRRQRALQQAQKLVKLWQADARKKGDTERLQVLRYVAQCVAPASGREACPDLRAAADAWLKAIRPVQQRVFETRRSRQLWRLEDLERPLLETPIPTEDLHRAFRDLPLLSPVAERIVAAIVGVPLVNTPSRDSGPE